MPRDGHGNARRAREVWLGYPSASCRTSRSALLPVPPLALASAVDRERKIDRALDALGPLADRDVAFVGGGPDEIARWTAAGARPTDRRVAPGRRRARLPPGFGRRDRLRLVGLPRRRPGGAGGADRILRPGGRLARRPRLRPRRRLATARRPARVRHVEPARRPVPVERLPGPGRPLLLDLRHDRRPPGGSSARRSAPAGSRVRRGPEAAAPLVQRRALPPDARRRERSGRRGPDGPLGLDADGPIGLDADGARRRPGRCTERYIASTSSTIRPTVNRAPPSDRHARRSISPIRADRVDHAVEIVDDEPGPAVLDDLGHARPTEPDHGRPGAERLDHRPARTARPTRSGRGAHRRRPADRACPHHRPRRRSGPILSSKSGSIVARTWSASAASILPARIRRRPARRAASTARSAPLPLLNRPRKRR